MRIKVTPKKYEDVLNMPKEKHIKPKKPNILFRTLLKLVSLPDLMSVKFKCEKEGMEKLSKKEPCLFLMNHSSFIDLEIASSILYPRPFNIVATTDGFVGKSWLMRQIGCIPTKKFVMDMSLVRDLSHTVKNLKSSVIMYPEAGYSFDGTATTLPDSLGKFAKLLGVPVVMICTYGAFSRDPLYNNLQKRKINVSAKMKYLLSPEDVKEKSADEINEIIRNEFSFDNFKWQQENEIKIDEPFRADGLHRVLYKCPHCMAEGSMLGKGTTIKCAKCEKEYELDELGFLKAVDGDTKFNHVPDWYAWQRSCVREEIEKGEYSLSTPVKILMGGDTKHIFDVGCGVLTHNKDGFSLSGCDGKLEYSQNPQATYSICADFFWYEIGDVIVIGNSKFLYYCFPEDKDVCVAKTRLAAEELYKIYKSDK